MRLWNPTDRPIHTQLSRWVHPNGGAITLSLPYEPGQWTEELDPEDPLVKKLMESGLKPARVPTWFEKVLRGMPF